MPGLDEILCGGLTPSQLCLLEGTPGTGKATTTVRCLPAALERSETATYYLFDEGLAPLLARCHARHGPEATRRVGTAHVTQIDPAELSPGVRPAW